MLLTQRLERCEGRAAVNRVTDAALTEACGFQEGEQVK